MTLLSSSELSLIQDRELLLAKRAATDKIRHLLEQVEQELEPVVKQFKFPDEVIVRSGKISYGENYQGLPYIMLDYPRLFSRSSVFAFRTMFWWGNFFSATLHIGGKSLHNLKSGLKGSLDDLKMPQLFFAVGEDPWQYHYQPSNYQLLAEIEKPEVDHWLETKDFVKLSYRWPLEDYQVLHQQIPALFQKLMYCCDVKESGKH